MASMLDMALDDVIAASKAEKRNKQEGNKTGEKSSSEKNEGNDTDMADAGGDAPVKNDENSSSLAAAADDAGGDSNTEMKDAAQGTAKVKQEHDRDGGGRGGGGRGGGGRGRGRGRTSRRHQPYHQNRNNRGGDDGPSGSAEQSRRVYVGNLSWDVSWRELKDHMKTAGCEVTRADVLTGHDGRSKGCGIVEFADLEGAKKAVLTLNDTDLMGRQIFVREDREEGASSAQGQHVPHQQHHHQARRGGGGGEAYSSGGDAQGRRCYVGNLSWDVAWQDLKDHMRQAGDVVHAEVMTEQDGRSKGCGIVEFATPEEAQEAIDTLTDSELKGRMIFVREDRETSSGGPGGRQAVSVYVGNLAYETSWQDLKDHMRAAGNVDQANILSGDDGRSKGCGIVQYQRPQEAARAIRELQNSVLHGRPIFVREDREQGSMSGGGSGSQLFVGNLSYDTTWKELKDHFRQCGDVERAEVMEGPDGRKKGFGTVRFARAKDASNAIRRLNGVDLMGRSLEVRVDHKAN